jgi:hypothetical protein
MSKSLSVWEVGLTKPTSTQPTSTQPTSTQPTSTQPTSTQPTSTQPTSMQTKVADIADGTFGGKNALEDWLRTPHRHEQLWDKENLTGRVGSRMLGGRGEC